MFKPLDEVTGGGIQVAISNLNDQGYCRRPIVKVLVILCKHARKIPGLHLAFLITSTICAFITSFSSIWLSIPVGSNKYRRRKSRAHILLSFLTQSCSREFFYAGGLELVLD